MKKIRYLFLAVFTLATFSYVSSVMATRIKGAGATSCGDWAGQRANNNYNLELAWVTGFMSSYNHYVDSTSKKNGIFGEINYNSITLWMDNYCMSNPSESVYSGSVRLIEEMKQK